MSLPGDIDAADAALVGRARTGDVDAFGQLVDRHRRAMYRAALAALGSAADAEDAAQDACVAAFQHIGAFRGEASFKTWLLAITWRCAASRRRSLRTWMHRLAFAPRDAGHEQDLEAVPARGVTPDEQLAAVELHRAIRGAIGRLPRRLRETLLLAGSGDYSYEEIAAMLGVPVGTVKWRVSEARRRVKRGVVRSQKSEVGGRKSEDGTRNVASKGIGE